MTNKLHLSLIASAFALGAAPAALAQGYFMPPSAPQQSAPAPQQQASAPAAPAAPAQDDQGQPPAPPQLPALTPEAAPPTAVIGLLNVPEVMKASTAVQGIQAEVQKRQADLGKEVQDASTKIQAEQQAIADQHGKIPDADLEAKEQTLRDQYAEERIKFTAKNDAIQASGQEALGKVEAELIGIIRQEAQAHGMNLILRDDMVVMPGPGFDLTDETVAELNKLLPSVTVPPAVVTPEMEQNAAQEQQQGGQDNGQ